MARAVSILRVNLGTAVLCCTAMFAAILVVPAAHAQTFTVLHTFSGGSDGGHPGPLTMDAEGNLYGAASLGGYEGADCQFLGENGC